MAAGYIAAADAVEGGHLFLGVGRVAVEPVAAADDVGLPGVQAILHGAPHPQAVFFILQVGEKRVIGAHHIQKVQRVAAAVSFDGVGEGDLALKLALGAEVHQNFVRYPLLTDFRNLPNFR